MYRLCACSVLSNSLGPHGLQTTRLLWPCSFTRQEYWIGLHFLLQGIFPTQRLNLYLLLHLHWQVDSSPLSHRRRNTMMNKMHVLFIVWEINCLEWCVLWPFFNTHFTLWHAHLLSHGQLFCHPIDWDPPGSFVHRNLQARILEWVAILFSRGFSPPRDQTSVSCVSCIGRQILLPPSHLGSPLSHHDRVIYTCVFVHT